MKADLTPSNPRVQHPVPLRYRAAAAVPVGAVAFLGSPAAALAMHARGAH